MVGLLSRETLNGVIYGSFPSLVTVSQCIYMTFRCFFVQPCGELCCLMRMNLWIVNVRTYCAKKNCHSRNVCTFLFLFFIRHIWYCAIDTILCVCATETCRLRRTDRMYKHKLARGRPRVTHYTSPQCEIRSKYSISIPFLGILTRKEAWTLNHYTVLSYMLAWSVVMYL